MPLELSDLLGERPVLVNMKVPVNQRNETLLADNRRLRAENQTLRDELAVP